MPYLCQIKDIPLTDCSNTIFTSMKLSLMQKVLHELWLIS